MNLPLKKVVPVVLAGLVWATTVRPQTNRPKTVLDFYKLLPEKYFEADQEQRIKWMLDPKRGAVVDIRNGYLYAPGDGAQTAIYVCLFKANNGSTLVGVEFDRDFMYLAFYSYKNGSWNDVTKSVLPINVNKEWKYEMPRDFTILSGQVISSGCAGSE